MAEPFKNVFNLGLIKAMGERLSKSSPDFDARGFEQSASRGLDGLELKERSVHIRNALERTLPDEFRSACEVMRTALAPASHEESTITGITDAGISGWAIMPMADFVAKNGLEDVEFSLDILKEMTSRFTSEFAVRPFFVQAPEISMQHAHQWSEDDNVHVRRLASEGTRPRLPWGLRLQEFVADPAPLFPILDRLKDDDAEYVRRSVANSLNDISKDHPDLVAKYATDWLKNASKDRYRMMRHACRSLIKQGHEPTLKAFGFGYPRIELKGPQIATPHMELGQNLEFSIELTSISDTPQSLIIDFIIHHKKASGHTSPKVFKWKVLDLAPGDTISLRKKHAIKPITTRVYYPGTHRVEIQINGKSFGSAPFELKTANE